MSQLSPLNVDPLVANHLHTGEYLVRCPIVEGREGEEEYASNRGGDIVAISQVEYKADETGIAKPLDVVA